MKPKWITCAECDGAGTSRVSPGLSIACENCRGEGKIDLNALLYGRYRPRSRRVLDDRPRSVQIDPESRDGA